MDIMSLFRQPKTENQQPVPPGNIPQTANQPADINNSTAANPENKEDKKESPLDKFTDAWKNESNADNSATVAFNADPQKIMEAAAKVDFSKHVTKDQLAAIVNGGENAAQAMMQMLNGVAQGVYAQSALATSKIVENALNAQADKYEKNLPSLVKRLGVSDSLRSENPALNHPAVQPLVSAIESKLAAKFPDASQTELKAMVNEYFGEISTVFSGKKTEQSANTSAKQGSTDWSDFLS